MKGTVTYSLLLITLLYGHAPIVTWAQNNPVPFRQALTVSASGISQVLMFGQAEEATARFDVGIDQPAPPAPPVPSFDARLTNEADALVAAYFTDVRPLQVDDQYTIFIRPPSEMVTEMTISWPSLTDYGGELTLHIAEQDVNLVVADTVTLAVGPQGVEGIITVHVPVGIEQVGEDIPDTYVLYPSYPNPFNPVTTIRFDLPQPGDVMLRVYNVQGREVATLVSSYFAQGQYQTTWDARGFASGVYMYRLRAGNFTDAKTMVLLR